MRIQMKTSFLFFMLTFFICVNFFFLTNTNAQVSITPVAAPDDSNYTFESIEVEGVQFLALTASSDFEDYAGYTQLVDGEKEVAFTIIDGVFATYDFPGSQGTRFYALGNNGNAAGYYVNSEGHHKGVVLENGELRQYDFPGSVQTEIFGISDATGALTGNFIDAEGVRRGFTGDEIIEFPGASATYADFVSAGRLVGSYIDAEGIYHAYIRFADGFTSIDLPDAANLDYYFVHGINDAGIYIERSQAVDDIPRTYIATYAGREELRVPGSVSTEGYNINQDSSVVGNYDTADGNRHGFIARPAVEDSTTTNITGDDWTYESIDVPGVDFLELTASSDFENYAGNTKSADGAKTVGFTLIDDVFETYDFPGSQNTYLYALGNDGRAAGHYEDSDGLHHGVILENGELTQYDFPGAVETFVYGISDATGVLTGSFIDAEGIRRGFSGDITIEYPGAVATYADFVNASGIIVGSYIDAEGVYHAYTRFPDGNIQSVDFPQSLSLEYFFVHGINDAGITVTRVKFVGDIPRTYVATLQGSYPLQFPGSVSTQGWNINQDSSVVGYYDTADERRHGFIARPAAPAEPEPEDPGDVFNVSLAQGLNMISLPLAPPTPMNARALAALTEATTVITLDVAHQQFVGWTPDAPDDGFLIEGGKGYIVNVSETRQVAFVGSAWTNESAAAAPTLSVKSIQGAWAFVVSGRLAGQSAFDGYEVSVRNLRTNKVITAPIQGDYFAAATADLTRRSVVQVGDVVELRVIGPDGNVESQTLSVKVTPEHLANAVMSVNLDSIGQPHQNQLLQNYPNPFNPETWIPYQLSEDTSVSISIYDTTGQLVRTLSLGFQSAGFYNSRERAAYWDGRNALGERVASGIYFYQLTTPAFQQTRRLVIVK